MHVGITTNNQILSPLLIADCHSETPGNLSRKSEAGRATGRPKKIFSNLQTIRSGHNKCPPEVLKLLLSC